ncbi:MAG TPA: GNAT family N-acetyltransferase [Candidatus Saccharimonadales bacterium]|nr:GNAT family N-acetyltransferase [Candidatus Saccharimonadales bacterium]
MNYSFEPQLFDTTLFGFAVAKITTIESLGDVDATISELVENLKKEHVRYATYRVHANDFKLIHSLEDHVFRLVDGLISLELTQFEAPKTKSEYIHPASLEDLEKLKHIAQTSFELNRFYNDSVIQKEKADELYGKWIENSIKGEAADTVLIYTEEDTILGFLTLSRNGHIPLIAVSKDARGKGTAKKLIQESFAYFKKWNIEKLTIETQMGNIPALRAYGTCGFKIVDSHLTFRWTDLG